MHGRKILYLLAGVCLVLLPTLLDSEKVRSSRAQPSPGLDYLTPGIPLPKRTVGRPDLRIPPRLPRGAESPELSRLVRAAGIIFSGTVTGVHPSRSGNGHSVATVAITFHIENVLGGTHPGREFTIHEWSGLWSGGQRYRVGERVLLFLYPASKLGLTSPVEGPIGRFAMDANGTVLLAPQHLSTFRQHSILAGKSRVRFSDFASAVKQAREEE